MDVSPASSRSSSGWFEVLQDDLVRQRIPLYEVDFEKYGRYDSDYVAKATVNMNLAHVLDDGTSTVSSLGVRREHRDPPSQVKHRERHERGQCDPCVFFTTKLGCLKGDSCPYCHLPHIQDKNQTTQRPRKQTRDKFKAAVQELLQINEGNLHSIHHELQAEARKNPYIRKLLQGYLDLDEPGSFGSEIDSFVSSGPPGLSIPPPPPLPDAVTAVAPGAWLSDTGGTVGSHAQVASAPNVLKSTGNITLASISTISTTPDTELTEYSEYESSSFALGLLLDAPQVQKVQPVQPIPPIPTLSALTGPSLCRTAPLAPLHAPPTTPPRVLQSDAPGPPPPLHMASLGR